VRVGVCVSSRHIFLCDCLLWTLNERRAGVGHDAARDSERKSY
jgi:hypothetical protein